MESLVEYSQVAIGGMAVIPMVIGLMQFAKKLGLRGNALVVAAFSVLTLVGGVAGAISEGVMPEVAIPYIDVAFYALGLAVTGMASMGLYEVGKDWATKEVVD